MKRDEWIEVFRGDPSDAAGRLRTVVNTLNKARRAMRFDTHGILLIVECRVPVLKALTSRTPSTEGAK